MKDNSIAHQSKLTYLGGLNNTQTNRNLEMALNITKGEWVLSESEESGYLYVSSEEGFCLRFARVAVMPCGEESQEGIANAELIAEAGTVANECGLTPRQLLEQRDELINALDELANGYAGCLWDTGLVTRLHNARQLLNKIKALSN